MTGGLKASGYQTLPSSLQAIADTERAFAARAKVVGWNISTLGSIPAEKGFYVRVWVRQRDGWKVALDVLQPQ